MRCRNSLCYGRATAITAAPAISLVLTDDTSALSSPVAAGDVVSYTYTATNDGNVTLTGVALDPTITDADGNTLVLTSGPTFVSADAGSADGTLLPGEAGTYTATYELTQSDIDAGGISQTATVDALSPEGANATDVSDDPSDATGDTDPTTLVIDAVPAALADNELVELVRLFPTVYEAEYVVTVTNDGNVTLNGVGVLDDLAGYLDPAVLIGTPSVVVNGFGAATPNAGYDGVDDTQLLAGVSELAPGETATISVTFQFSVADGTPGEGSAVVLTANELPEPIELEVQEVLNDEDEDKAFDTEESDTEDRDGDGINDQADYDPTGYFYCEEDGRILSGGEVSVTGPLGTQTGVGTSGNITIVEDGSTGFYQWYVTETGTYTMNITYPSVGAASTNRPVTASPTRPANMVDVITGTTDTDPRVLGAGEFGSTGQLSDYTEAANPSFYVSFDIQAGDPLVFNNNIPLRDCALNPLDIVATKTADRATVEKGGMVTYTMTFGNDPLGFDRNDITLVDNLPVGLLYTPGSAMIDGVAVEPVVSGRRLSWPNQDIARGETRTLVLTARVSTAAELGDIVNRAVVIDPVTGQAISNEARATVSLAPEHVFDCSDVIGKVFYDINGNGYQDAGEEGIAGARIMTVTGDIITADENGLYSVPCAALPSRIGSNFILKVDENSLPAGHRVTTENPRVVRLTAGTMTQVNFGVGVADVVDVVISADAFIEVDGELEVVEDLEKGVTALVAQLVQKPSVIRLTYTRSSESSEVARARLDVLEELIRSEWRRKGRFGLRIERQIRREY
ncbi:DUF7507 domain-containing protein [Yoonia maritima]|uniref:DUF7507 domain-containing protein n=1 Tax=Yoonia maritima TaxID=1435347 RepID=UPI000D110994|nr:DUF11 domain-containing protein [Yoonia maritima]